jgi:hypothetical protein
MQLHIVSFDIPYPANYGGVIDVFYKLKALHEAGIRIHLHCFQYGRRPKKELEAFCENVWYYPRKSFLSSFLQKGPYIVSSRQSPQLLQRLAADPYPVLFEGIHSCGHLADPALSGKMKVVRMHNIEWEYYGAFARKETQPIRKMYYAWESRKLRIYEPVLAHADLLLGISSADQAYLKAEYGKAEYLPAFHSATSVRSQPGRGTFCLYHGNLAVPENHEAALFVIKEIFSSIRYPLVIAGAFPRKALIRAIGAYSHIQLRANPAPEEMDRLISEAQIHVLPTFQSTGIKLKLLHALFRGRFVLVNPTMASDPGLADYCTVCPDAAAFKEAILMRFKQPFSETEISARNELLQTGFSNRKNAIKLKKWIFGDQA